MPKKRGRGERKRGKTTANICHRSKGIKERNLNLNNNNNNKQQGPQNAQGPFVHVNRASTRQPQSNLSKAIDDGLSFFSKKKIQETLHISNEVSHIQLVSCFSVFDDAKHVC